MIGARENKFQNSWIERLWRCAFKSATTLIRFVFATQILTKRSTFDRQIGYLLVQSTCDDSTWHIVAEITIESDKIDRTCLFVHVLVFFRRKYSRLDFFPTSTEVLCSFYRFGWFFFTFICSRQRTLRHIAIHGLPYVIWCIALFVNNNIRLYFEEE